MEVNGEESLRVLIKENKVAHGSTMQTGLERN